MDVPELVTPRRAPTWAGTQLQATGFGGRPTTEVRGMSSTGEIADASVARPWRDLTNALTYGAATGFAATLWLVAVHIFEGSHERKEPPFILHWLRDGALALPIAFLAAGFALRIAASWPASRRALALPGIVALTTSTFLIATMPFHELLFVGRSRQYERLGWPIHMLREWLIALAVTFCAAAIVIAIKTRD